MTRITFSHFQVSELLIEPVRSDGNTGARACQEYIILVSSTGFHYEINISDRATIRPVSLCVAKFTPIANDTWTDRWMNSGGSVSTKFGNASRTYLDYPWIATI